MIAVPGVYTFDPISDELHVCNPGGFGILYNGVQVVYGDTIVDGGTYISDSLKY